MYEWDFFSFLPYLTIELTQKKGYYLTKKIRKYIRMNWRVRYKYINMLCIWLNYMSRIFPFQWMVWFIFERAKSSFVSSIFFAISSDCYYDLNYSSETHRLIMLSNYWRKNIVNNILLQFLLFRILLLQTKYLFQLRYINITMIWWWMTILVKYMYNSNFACIIYGRQYNNLAPIFHIWNVFKRFVEFSLNNVSPEKKIRNTGLFLWNIFKSHFHFIICILISYLYTKIFYIFGQPAKRAKNTFRSKKKELTRLRVRW